MSDSEFHYPIDVCGKPCRMVNISVFSVSMPSSSILTNPKLSRTDQGSREIPDRLINMLLNILRSLKAAAVATFEAYHQMTWASLEVLTDDITDEVEVVQSTYPEPVSALTIAPRQQGFQAATIEPDTVEIPKQTFDSIVELLQFYQYLADRNRTLPGKVDEFLNAKERIADLSERLEGLQHGIECSTIEDRNDILKSLKKRISTVHSASTYMQKHSASYDQAADHLMETRDALTEIVCNKLKTKGSLPKQLSHLSDDLSVKSCPMSAATFAMIEKEANEIDQAISDSYKNAWEEDDDVQEETNEMGDRMRSYRAELDQLEADISEAQETQPSTEEGESDLLAELLHRKTELTLDMRWLSHQLGLRGIRVTPEGEFVYPENEIEDDEVIGYIPAESVQLHPIEAQLPAGGEKESRAEDSVVQEQWQDKPRDEDETS